MSDKKDNSPLADSVHKVWLAGLGALATAEQEGSKLFNSLVEKGETYGSKGKDQINDLREKVGEATSKAREKAGESWDQVSERLDDVMSGVLGRLGVPNREEIATLTKRVEELTKVVEKLGKAEGAKNAKK